jgi:hypothetical protein
VTTAITDIKNTTDPSEVDASSVPQKAAAASASRTETAQSVIAEAAPAKPRRTLGLKLFDATFYGGVVNTIIFLASTASTYWTYHGNTVGKAGSALRWCGEQFYKRRKPIENALGKIGVTGEAGKVGTTVFWSFVDGTVFTPLIKMIEDRRERIALSIDTLLGTKADNMRAYDAEPKQSWKSVFIGRMGTLGIVLPVAILMEKTGGNKRIFYNGGDKIMRALEVHAPTLDRKMTSLVAAPHAPGYATELGIRKKALFQVLTFEGFYTSICTIGTYLFSRVFARNHPKVEKHNDTTAHAAPAMTSASLQRPSEGRQNTTLENPATKISATTHLSRIAAPDRTPELTT